MIDSVSLAKVVPHWIRHDGVRIFTMPMVYVKNKLIIVDMQGQFNGGAVCINSKRCVYKYRRDSLAIDDCRSRAIGQHQSKPVRQVQHHIVVLWALF